MTDELVFAVDLPVLEILVTKKVSRHARVPKGLDV